MSFFSIMNPMFLWLLPVAVFPVVFHLFFKFRKKVVTFPSFMFFFMIDQKFSARRKLREYLILASRVLFILFFLLALANIVRFGGDSSNTRLATVIIVDNSASMGAYAKANLSKVNLSIQAANALIDSLQDSDSATIVLTVDDPATSLPEGVTANKGVLKSALNSIVPTEGEGNIQESFKRAFKILKDSYASKYEIHVFSDMQEHEWKKSSLDLTNYRPGTEIIVHKLASANIKEGNVSVSSIDFLQNRFISNRSAGVDVSLENGSDSDSQVQVVFEDDSGTKKVDTILVGKKSERVISYTITPKSPGMHWVRVKIEGDAFQGDNIATASYNCTDKKKAIFCGERRDFGNLPIAISPDRAGLISGISLSYTTNENLVKAIKGENPEIVIINWNRFSTLKTSISDYLRKYIYNGGNLLVLPSVSSSASVTQTPIWSKVSLGRQIISSTGLSMMVLNRKLPFWSGLKDERGGILLRNMHTFKYNQLKASGDYKELLGLEDGRPLLINTKIGDGNFYSSSLAFSAKWSNLPLKASFVPLVHKMVLTSGSGTDVYPNIVAGSRTPNKKRNAMVHMRSIIGSPLDWRGNGRIVIPQTGVYSIEENKDDETLYSYFSVSSSPHEGKMRFIKDESLQVLEGVNYRVKPLNDIASFVEEFQQRRSGVNYFIPLLFLALIMLLLESYLSNEPRTKVPVPKGHGVGLGMALIPPVGMIQWHPDFSPVLSLLSVALICTIVYLSWKRLQDRLPKRKVIMVLIPRVIILALILAAFFDPIWVSEENSDDKGKLLVLLDDSSSMEVKDMKSGTRYERGKRIAEKIAEDLPSEVDFELLNFDTGIREKGAKKGEGQRGTDLAGTIVSLDDRADVSSCRGVLILTDGGDENVDVSNYPSAPLYVVGIGAKDAAWDDLAIEELKYPHSSEKDVDFEIVTDIYASFSINKPAGGLPVSVILEREVKGKWQKVEEKKQKIVGSQTRFKLRLKEDEPGSMKYRISVSGMKDELSMLNNSREFKINIQKQSLHVLYYTGKIGVNFKMLRSELARDPGVSFTALLRTIRNSYMIQGDRINGDDKLANGFPYEKKILELYDTIIIDSFPAEFWLDKQAVALKKYVESGGTVVFLGGEYSFGEGGYAKSPLKPLFPWRLRTSGIGLKRGRFHVKVPNSASSNSIISGIKEIISQTQNPVIESLNLPGQLKPSAAALLDADYKGQNIPFVAVQPFGEGQVMGIATNMLWKWAASSRNLRKAYSLFWRQGVRNLPGEDRGGRNFSVRWNKEFYRPGEVASAVVRVAEDQNMGSTRLVASVKYDNKSTQVPVEKIVGSDNAYSLKMLFRERGDYDFRMTLYQEKSGTDDYEKAFSLSPLLSEGSDLGLDKGYLKSVAEEGGGKYYDESDVDNFIKDIKDRVFSSKVTIERSLIHHGPWFFILIMLILITEWIIRRKVNLL